MSSSTMITSSTTTNVTLQFPVDKFVFYFSVDFPYISGSNSSKWPIRCYVRLQPSLFNVNAGQGGAASLVQISNSYGSDGGHTTSEVFLLR